MSERRSEEVREEALREVARQEAHEAEVMVVRLHRETLLEMGYLAQRLYEVSSRMDPIRDQLARGWLDETRGLLERVRHSATPEGRGR